MQGGTSANGGLLESTKTGKKCQSPTGHPDGMGASSRNYARLLTRLQEGRIVSQPHHGK